MTVWFTSDQHYFHKNIISHSKRPFSDVEEMNGVMIERYNSVIRVEDTCYMLGDFALDHRKIPQILPHLNGEKILVSGNHDSCHPCHHRWERYVRKYLEYGFSVVLERLYYEEFLLCHFPYAGRDSQHEGRYPEWRPEQEIKKWLLHGHIHELNHIDYERRQFNVGVDVNNFTPISLEQVRGICQRSARA